MNPKLRNFKDLHIWQKSMGLCKVVYALTAHFPKLEQFGLISQMRRCAVSIPSNIAVGSKKRTKNDFSHFIAIATGSLAELETQLLIAHSQQYMDQATSREHGYHRRTIQNDVFISGVTQNLILITKN